MPPEQRSEALLEALRFLVTSSVPAEYKRTLIDVVTQAMRTDEAAHRDFKVEQQAAAQWYPTDVATLQQLLQGKSARSWQEADEVLMRVAAQLKRDPAGVRSKAMELNLGSAVDYKLAQAQIRSNPEP